MYKQKSAVIEQIQSYHKQVAKLYEGLYERIEDEKMKSIIHDLHDHEKSRENYLEKHKNVAKAMNSWLSFSCDKLSNQISECFKDINTESDLTMDEIIRIEMYFDNCLIKLYNILALENGLSETATNIFYYMLKKTKKEETILSNMFYNANTNLHDRILSLNV
jgi:rubrerythrin